MAQYFRISRGTTHVKLRQPESYDKIKTKDIRRLYFWASTAVKDVGKSSDEITLNGLQYSTSTACGESPDFPLGFPIGFDSELIYYEMQDLEDMVNAGEHVTITDLKYPTLNATYLFKDFNYEEVGGRPNEYIWSITLEKV